MEVKGRESELKLYFGDGVTGEEEEEEMEWLREDWRESRCLG